MPNHDWISERKSIFNNEIWAMETTPRPIVIAIEYKKALSRKFRQSRRSSEVPDSNWIGSASYVILEKPCFSIFSIWDLTHVLCLNASTLKRLIEILFLYQINILKEFEILTIIDSTFYPKVSPSRLTIYWRILSAFSFIDSSISSFKS